MNTKKYKNNLSDEDISTLVNGFKKHIPKQTKDKEKLEQQRTRLAGTCKICGEPLTHITGNILVCTNPSCKGVTKNEGTEYESKESFYRLLDEKGAKIAENIFDEGMF